MNGVRKAKRTALKPENSSIYASELEICEYAEKYLIAILHDAKCILKGLYSNADATRDASTIKCRLRAEGSGFATRTLPNLASGLFMMLEHGMASFPQFSLLRGTEYPRFLCRLFHLAFNSVDQSVKVNAISLIYTISVAFKKLKGDYPDHVIQQFFADFCKTDKDLGNLDFHSKELRLILEDACAQMRIFVNDTNLLRRIDGSTPQPGPGATNHPTEKNMRYRPHVLYKQIDDVFPYADWFYPTPYDVLGSDANWHGTFNVTVSGPTARFKTVPKTYGKPRGICIEQNETQVFQQLVRKAMYEAIADHFGDRIALRKQSVNAGLAMSSSASGQYATIDMSEASDRISRELVIRLTAETPAFRRVLLALATKTVEPPDKLKGDYPNPIRLNKFAPMGSALCFPVMSIVHMFLIRAIIRVCIKGNTRHLSDDVYVYGDDIILPTECVEHVYNWLPKFGMKLNKDKSFYRSRFRESCGVHAYNGVDITPVYVKYIPFHGCPGGKPSVFAVESQLFKKGLHKTAEVQRAAITDAYGEYPYVPAGLSLAGYARDFDDAAYAEFKTKHRHTKSHRKYQTHRYRIKTFVKRSEKLVLPSDLDAYTRWMWMGVENAATVSDSRDDLVEVTRVVLESAIGAAAYGMEVEKLVLKQFPTVTGRMTHPSWFGRLQKNFAVIGARCYL